MEPVLKEAKKIASSYGGENLVYPGGIVELSVWGPDSANSDPVDPVDPAASGKRRPRGGSKKGSAKRRPAKKGSAKRRPAKKGSAKKGSAKRRPAKKGSKKNRNRK